MGLFRSPAFSFLVDFKLPLFVPSYCGGGCGRGVDGSPTLGFRRVSMPATGPGDILNGPLIVGILHHY